MPRLTHDHLCLLQYEAGDRVARVERTPAGWVTWLHAYDETGRCVRQVRTEWGEQSTKARQVAREWVEGRRVHGPRVRT